MRIIHLKRREFNSTATEKEMERDREKEEAEDKRIVTQQL